MQILPDYRISGIFSTVSRNPRQINKLLMARNSESRPTRDSHSMLSSMK